MEQSVISLGAIPKTIAVTTPKITHRVDMVYYQEVSSGTQLKMDVLLPESDTLRPAILFLPGGGFTTADYHKTLPLRLFLAQAGYVVASAMYRPVPEQFPTLVHDAKHALAYLYRQAQELQIDPENISVMGDSAGGYLTQLLLTTANTTTFLPEDVTLAETKVKVAISLYGFSNLLTMTNTTQFEPGTLFSNQEKLSPEKVLLKGASADKAHAYTAEELYEQAKIASPIEHVEKTPLAPLLMLHGDHDALVPIAQSNQMFDRLKTNQQDVTYWIIEGADHGSVEFSQTVLFEQIATWLHQKGK